MISRPFPGRPANDNPAPFDVTRLTLQIFGGTLMLTLIVGPVWLVSVWQ
ncbi:hypothetical protein [Methylobacterium flocculans]|nr:hypothetical protein [Methylobacterium sp. FF17]